MYYRLDGKRFLSDEYARGIVQFLDYAYSHPKIMDRGCIKCPCLKCHNLKFNDQETIYYHLIVMVLTKAIVRRTFTGNLFDEVQLVKHPHP